jgi:hypothetical protein
MKTTAHDIQEVGQSDEGFLKKEAEEAAQQ